MWNFGVQTIAIETTSKKREMPSKKHFSLFSPLSFLFSPLSYSTSSPKSVAEVDPVMRTHTNSPMW